MKTLNKEICKELGVPQYVKRPIPAYAIQIIPENQALLEKEERLNLEAKFKRWKELSILTLVIILLLEMIMRFGLLRKKSLKILISLFKQV